MVNKQVTNFEGIAEKVLSDRHYTDSKFEKDVRKVLSEGFKLTDEQVNYTYTLAFREGQLHGKLGILEVVDDLVKYAKVILN